MKTKQTARWILKLSLLFPVIVLWWTGIAHADTKDKIDPLIFEQIDRAGETRFIVYLQEKADLRTAAFISDWSTKGYVVYDALRATADRTQAPLLAILNQKMIAGTVSDVAPYWICNCVAATGDREAVLTLAARPDVEKITANRELQVLEPEEIAEADAAPAAVEWNVTKIRADQVWETYGITGSGVTIGHMDTGVDWTHPALQSKYRGWNQGQPDHNYNWYDASAAGRREPYDSQIHGTHTMGTILGDDGGSNKIGVAPGAQWISALIIGRDCCSTFVEVAHKGFQWMLAPTDLDGQNPDPDKRPAVVNNSWGCVSGIPNCSDYAVFWDDIGAWIAAGIVPEFSAGNEGRSGLRTPADYPQTFAVGSTDRNDNISGFSSLGPSRYDGSVKPNVSAPGSGVRSASPNNRYVSMDGTSMAGPHVVGLVALLLEANPNLSIEELQTLLQDTAIPRGAERPNNTYGWGRIDALNAVEAVLALPARK